MCPDHQLLSAYYDQELDSEWEKRIDDHVLACPVCREKLDSYATLSEELLHASLPNLEESQLRSWQVIESRRRVVPIRLWSRRLSVPLPAFIAAAAVFAFALGIGIFFSVSALSPQSSRSPIAAASRPESAAMDIQVNNLNEIINYLDSQELGDNVTIQLPKDIDRMSVGQPQLLRAADYKRGQ